jgi:hypothetical protein
VPQLFVNERLACQAICPLVGLSLTSTISRRTDGGKVADRSARPIPPTDSQDGSKRNRENRTQAERKSAEASREDSFFGCGCAAARGAFCSRVRIKKVGKIARLVRCCSPKTDRFMAISRRNKTNRYKLRIQGKILPATIRAIRARHPMYHANMRKDFTVTS